LILTTQQPQQWVQAAAAGPLEIPQAQLQAVLVATAASAPAVAAAVQARTVLTQALAVTAAMVWFLWSNTTEHKRWNLKDTQWSKTT
jgi:hypothetical protein